MGKQIPSLFSLKASLVLAQGLRLTICLPTCTHESGPGRNIVFKPGANLGQELSSSQCHLHLQENAAPQWGAPGGCDSWVLGQSY